MQQLLAQTRKAAKELEQRAREQRAQETESTSQQPSGSVTKPKTMGGLEALREDHKRLEQAEAEGVGTEARAVIDILNHLMTERQRKGDA